MRRWGFLSLAILISSIGFAQATAGGSRPVGISGGSLGTAANPTNPQVALPAPGTSGAQLQQAIPAPLTPGTTPQLQQSVPGPLTPGTTPQLQQAMPGPLTPGTNSQLQQAVPAPGTPVSTTGGLNTQTPQAGGFLTTPSVSLSGGTAVGGGGGGAGAAGSAFIRTPVMSLDPQAFSPVGASNATGMLLPGATDSTLANHPDDISNFMDTRAQARLPFDRGAGSFSSVYDVGQEEPRSLGEVAAEYRARRNQVARTVTNQDLERMNQPSGGTAGAVVNAPAAPSPTEPSPAVAQPAAPQEAPTPMAPQEMAQATTPAAPTQSAGQQGTSENNTAPLPATGSPLPLVALLGLIAGAAGMLCRR